MRASRALILATSLLMVVGTAVLLDGCYGIPKGTAAQVQVGSAQITATGAGIIKADASKTTIQIRCSDCGYQTDTITIDTPTPGHPYTLKWVCPVCGHKQTVVVSAI